MEKLEKENRYAVILAGGGGTRLWPKSRTSLPKQFLKIGSDKTLFQMTFERLNKFISTQKIFIVTRQQYLAEIEKELPVIDRANILIEPSSKNTGPAIALAISHIHKMNREAVVGSFAADHLVLNEKEFLKVLEAAYLAALKTNALVAVGIVPNKPDEGLGYIHLGGQVDEIKKCPVFKVKRFVEKPDLTTATAYLASGEYFWNASYFIGRSDTFFKAYQKYFPEVLEIINSPDFAKQSSLWDKVKNIAVDYAIMEKIDNMLMVTGEIGWSDIGNWSVLSEIFPADKDGNVELVSAQGKYVTVESKNCLLHADGRMIAVLGVSDLVVIDTADAILVCHKDKAQEVRKIVEKIKEKKWKEYL